MDMLGAALGYARGGFYVFPCNEGGKEPLGVLAPHGFKDATIDEGTIRKWWGQYPNANIGIATGKISGIVVIDVDPRNGGDINAVPPLPDSWLAKTGGGGWHLYYPYPKDKDVPSKKSPGYDLKSDGGYVIAPPSVHPSGGRYEWPDSTTIDRLESK